MIGNYILYILILYKGHGVTLNSQVYHTQGRCKEAEIEAIKQNEIFKNRMGSYYYRTWCQKQ